MKKILLQIKIKLKKLQTDLGKEFYNTEFLEYLGVDHYSTFSNVNVSIVERVNRTLKQNMWKQFSLQGTNGSIF